MSAAGEMTLDELDAALERAGVTELVLWSSKHASASEAWFATAVKSRRPEAIVCSSGPRGWPTRRAALAAALAAAGVLP